MSDPRSSPPLSAVASAPPAFARVWRLLLPAGLAVMAAAAALGVFDTTAVSAWIFVAGGVVGIVGVASLALHLFVLGRRGVDALEKRLEDEFDGHGSGPK